MNKLILLLAALVVISVVMATYSHLPTRQPPQSGAPRLPVGTRTAAVAIGAAHGIILASDGSLWSWGEQPYPQEPVLGLGAVTNQQALRRINSDTNWKAVAAGSQHSLAVKSDGSLWGWGGNNCSQLGDGTRHPCNQPTRSVPGNEWQLAAVGEEHSLAIKSDGSLWAWGCNQDGQLGIGSTNDMGNAVQVGTGSNWVKVDAVMFQSAGLQSDGSLWVWGRGIMTDNYSSEGKRFSVPTRVLTDTKWKDFAVGIETALAVRADCSLWGWGVYAYVRPAQRDPTVPPTPVRIGTGTNWQSCSQGGTQALLQKNDGSIWILDVPRLKDPRFVIASYPCFKKLQLPTTVAAFGAGELGTFAAVLQNGEVWTWGVVLGEYPPRNRLLHAVSSFINEHTGTHYNFGAERSRFDAPWQLCNVR